MPSTQDEYEAGSGGHGRGGAGREPTESHEDEFSKANPGGTGTARKPMIHAATAAKAILTGFWSKPSARATKMEDTPTSTHVDGNSDQDEHLRPRRRFEVQAALGRSLGRAQQAPEHGGMGANDGEGDKPDQSHSHPGTWLSIASTGAANPHVTAAAATIAA